MISLLDQVVAGSRRDMEGVASAGAGAAHRRRLRLALGHPILHVFAGDHRTPFIVSRASHSVGAMGHVAPGMGVWVRPAKDRPVTTEGNANALGDNCAVAHASRHVSVTCKSDGSRSRCQMDLVSLVAGSPLLGERRGWVRGLGGVEFRNAHQRVRTPVERETGRPQKVK